VFSLSLHIPYFRADHYFPATPIALFNAFYLAVPEALFLANAVVYANKEAGKTTGFTSAEFGETSGVSRSRTETESVKVSRVIRSQNGVKPQFIRAGSSGSSDVSLLPTSAAAGSTSSSDTLILLPGDGHERSDA
jgi:hypothetical protein